MKLIEAVPNFSEGQNEQIIQSIAKALSSQRDTKLLDIDSGFSANRTVYSLIGTPESILEALFQGIKEAVNLIDMRKHHGAHPRIGAMDVCPLIPFLNSTLKECVLIAQKLGQRVWSELNVPVYLYEEAAKNPARKNLAVLRKGEYEGTLNRIDNPELTTDFGEGVFNQTSGTAVIGARDFLIAYNINVSGSVYDAKKIAGEIRESGYLLKDEKSNLILDAKHKPIRHKGLLKSVKAIGWYLEDFSTAQVSTNIIDINKVSILEVYQTVENEAKKLGIKTNGSELVGMIPMKAFYQNESFQNQPITQQRKRILDLALKLGLNQIKPFDPDQKVIELKLHKEKYFYET